MALQATLDSLDDLPDALHEHYEQDGDVYRLRVEGYDDTGLKVTLEDKKKEVKKLRDKLRDYEGIDPEEVAELRQLRDEYEDKIAQAGDWEEHKARLEAKWSKDLDAVQSERTALEAQLSDMLKENTARAALAEANARVDALLPHVLDRVQIVSEEGKRRAVAVGLDGETETDIPSLVGEMKEAGDKFDWGFLPNGNSGTGGAAGSGGGSAGKVRSKKDLKSAAEHSRYIAEHGLPAYQELPRE